jgi:hypothetical protein
LGSVTPLAVSFTPTVPAVPSKSARPIFDAGKLSGAPAASIAMRAVAPTSAAAFGAGTMKRSALLVALPFAVVTPTLPPVTAGARTVSAVSVAASTAAVAILILAWLSVGTGSNAEPLTVNATPAATIAGVSAVICGGCCTITVNAVALVTLPSGAVTEIGPVVAPAGTVATSVVGLALVTVAGVPLKRTVFCAGVAPKPVPKIVTRVPTGPCAGVNETIASCEEALRATEVRLPASS